MNRLHNDWHDDHGQAMRALSTMIGRARPGGRSGPPSRPGALRAARSDGGFGGAGGVKHSRSSHRQARDSESKPPNSGPSRCVSGHRCPRLSFRVAAQGQSPRATDRAGPACVGTHFPQTRLDPHWAGGASSGRGRAHRPAHGPWTRQGPTAGCWQHPAQWAARSV
jgi:hypothetical protein